MLNQKLVDSLYEARQLLEDGWLLKMMKIKTGDSGRLYERYLLEKYV